MTDWYKKLSGNSKEEDFRFPKAEQTSAEMWKQANSKYKLRLLGENESTQVLLSEEERGEHMHIIGTTGEGKSRFLEHLVREDIDRGNGLCFLDSSDGGDTVYKILAYCAKVGHKKVLLIDPASRYDYNKIVPINPLQGNKEASVSNVRDAIQTTFGNKDQSETPRIQRYLTAILSLLWNAGMTIREAKYFSDPLYIRERKTILEQSDEMDRHRLALEEVFNSRAMYLNELQSTLRRLEVYQHPTLELMFGTKEGIKFTDLISQGWVVLVNLYSGAGFEPIHAKLLGTTIINEIVDSIDRLRDHGWKGRYYLYIDEAGQYATQKLANLLAYKRKSGLAVIIAHQYFGQFEDKAVLDAVLNLCKLKVAFNIPNPDDRLKVVKMFYGGALADRDVSYALSQIRKQHAVIKLSKMDPALIKIPNVPDIEVDTKPYLEALYNESTYLDVDDLLNEQRKRFEGQDTVRAERGTKPNRRTANKVDGSKAGYRKKSPQSPVGQEADNSQADSGLTPEQKKRFEDLFLETK
ncbi:MAG: hypothetical protein AB1757_06880 [Acidobacteriota bacterium]